MAIATTFRQASKDEMAREIDRCHAVIEQLEARISHIEGIYPGAIDHLNHHQRQLDMDGIEVAVSRQALTEVLTALEAFSYSEPAPQPQPLEGAVTVNNIIHQIALWSDDEGLELSMGQGEDLARRIRSALEEQP